MGKATVSRCWSKASRAALAAMTKATLESTFPKQVHPIHGDEADPKSSQKFVLEVIQVPAQPSYAAQLRICVSGGVTPMGPAQSSSEGRGRSLWSLPATLPSPHFLAMSCP